MPIYEYNCSKCDAFFEVLVRSKRDSAPRCPKCGAGKPKKAFSAFAVQGAQPQRGEVPCGDCSPGDCGGAGGCPMAGACAKS